MEKFRKEVENLLKSKTTLKEAALEIPPDPLMGDFAFPCFALAKESKQSPNEIAESLAKEIPLTALIEKIAVKGPYLNFFVNKGKLIEETLKEIKESKSYGSKPNNKKTILIDYSHPNIAKPFGIGHLRSTVIGNSLKKIFQHLGYKVIGENYLGDWGTQFGKLIVAFNTWGDEEKLKEEPIKHLLDLYVQFHEEAKIHPELDDQARAAFKKLEDGDPAYYDIWHLFRELSLREFKKYYKELEVDFEFYSGEEFYMKMVDDAIIKLQNTVETKVDDGALIVELDNMPPFMLKKSDGASTYHSRDLAAVIYRLDRFKPEKLIYVVGAPQRLHFNQLFSVVDKMGLPSQKFIHVDFGHLNFKDAKMSTREGSIIFLEEVLDRAIEIAKKTINEKNPDLKNKEKVSRVIGIGAVIFADLTNDRVREMIFDWDKILDFEGETAPYLQYTYARISSIIRKANSEFKNVDVSLLEENDEFLIARKLAAFPTTVENAAEQLKPHVIARYLLDLGQLFNTYYQKYKVIQDNKELMNARLLLIDSVRNVIAQGLSLLGIKVVEEM